MRRRAAGEPTDGFGYSKGSNENVSDDLQAGEAHRQAADWVTAMVASDRATAEAIAADHGREVWLGLREVPSEFQKWRWIAIRALVPTGGPSLKL